MKKLCNTVISSGKQIGKREQVQLRRLLREHPGDCADGHVREPGKREIA
jgi:hypothetical protein